MDDLTGIFLFLIPCQAGDDPAVRKSHDKTTSSCRTRWRAGKHAALPYLGNHAPIPQPCLSACYLCCQWPRMLHYRTSGRNSGNNPSDDETAVCNRFLWRVHYFFRVCFRERTAVAEQQSLYRLLIHRVEPAYWTPGCLARSVGGQADMRVMFRDTTCRII